MAPMPPSLHHYSRANSNPPLPGSDTQKTLGGWDVTGDRQWHYLVVADEQGRLGAQRGEDPCDLHRDVAGTDNDAAPAEKRRCRVQAPGAGAAGCGGWIPLYLGSSSSSKKPSLVIPRLAPAKQRPFSTLHLSPFPSQSLLCFGRPLSRLGAWGIPSGSPGISLSEGTAGRPPVAIRM